MNKNLKPELSQAHDAWHRTVLKLAGANHCDMATLEEAIAKAEADFAELGNIEGVYFPNPDCLEPIE